MIPVVTPAEMREIDASAPEPVGVLVERAGAAVAREALRMLGGAYGRRVVVMAGPGNNGADGRVAARRLAERGVSVRVIDAVDPPATVPACDLVIDAAFGTGFRGVWAHPDVGTARVLAVDVPTGLDASTGVAPHGLRHAERTITFHALKPGHVLGDGPDACGEVVLAGIGLPAGEPQMGVVDAADVLAWLPPRPRHAHKWRAAVRLIAGSPGMEGAAALAAAAAQRAGAGMVVLSVPGGRAGDAPVEVVQRDVPLGGWADAVLDDLHRFHALVLGPGLGRRDDTVSSVVSAAQGAAVPLLIDGDGLFALAWNAHGRPRFLGDRAIPAVLTPHDGEYGLLTGEAPGADRLGAARALAGDTGCIVLLKGPTTIVADPVGRVRFVCSGDQRLATAGTGDVLAGVIGALLASGVAPFEAAAAGAWLHGRAGALGPPVGLVAGDLVDAIPAVLASLSAPDRP